MSYANYRCRECGKIISLELSEEIPFKKRINSFAHKHCTTQFIEHNMIGTYVVCDLISVSQYPHPNAVDPDEIVQHDEEKLPVRYESKPPENTPAFSYKPTLDEEED